MAVFRLRKQEKKLKDQLLLKTKQDFKCRRIHKLPVNVQNIISTQLAFAKVKKQGRRWQPCDIKMSLSLYLRSSAAYSTMANVLTLPSVRTLFNYSHTLLKETGFCEIVAYSLEDETGRRTSTRKVNFSICIFLLQKIFL